MISDRKKKVVVSNRCEKMSDRCSLFLPTDLEFLQSGEGNAIVCLGIDISELIFTVNSLNGDSVGMFNEGLVEPVMNDCDVTVSQGQMRWVCHRELKATCVIFMDH